MTTTTTAATTTRLDLIRVLLVDDHPAFREAVRARLATVPRFQVVGEASDSDEALAQLRATRPHLAVIDISLGKFADVSGLVLARKVRDLHRETRVLICSMHGNDDYVAAARAAGTRGYILKSCRTEEIVKAIEVVVGGACYYSAGIEQVVVPRPELTARETEVLQLVARADSSRTIARELKIDCRTVETHRRNIMEKLGARNVVEMLRIAFRLGLINGSPSGLVGGEFARIAS
jgi:DNA-binding NarL/FixJ family response regulator